MSRTSFLSICAVAVLAVAAGLDVASRPATPERRTSEGAIAVYRSGLDALDASLVHLDAATATGDSDAAHVAFRTARRAFKRVELFVEYNGSFLARELNGVPIARAEDEDPETPLPPVGFQVVEAELFPAIDPSHVASVRKRIGFMRRAVHSLHHAGADTLAGDEYVFDAMRQEIARVVTLGLAGFDATITRDGITESAEALYGVRLALTPYRATLAERNRTTLTILDTRLDSAIGYLTRHPDFESFDRLRFITKYTQPLAHALSEAQRVVGVGAPGKPRAWSARSASPFDRNAFDLRFFASTDAPVPRAGLVSLGRELFFDPSLSPSRQRSCATCHVPERAFTDGLKTAALIAGHPASARSRNTPTLINAALQPALFADNRVRTLEDQATDVLGSASEMGGSLRLATDVLRRNPGYAERFAEAFGASRDSALTPRTLRLALAAYVRSLVALDSRFDRAARGDSMAVSEEERRGFDLFMGKGTCGTCHFAPLFNGAMPPTMLESEPEVIGVPQFAAGTARVVDPDSGRYRARRIAQQLFSFRTPTLRNIELTAPYMHNGAFRTLGEVIDFYDAGGGHGLGIELANQTLPSDSLRLTPIEKRQLLAFLATLTDTAGTTARP